MALVALLAVFGLGAWLRGEVVDDSKAFAAFCSATHVGETWEHVQERASARGWGFVRQSPQGKPAEEWLCQVELWWSYRAGCVVTVARGRVIDKKFAELP